MTLPLVDVSGLEFSRPTGFRLNVEHLFVSPHEVVGVVGPNGAGKSTLLQIVAGIERPDAGEILIRDLPLAGFTRLEIARIIGYLPQEVSSVYPYTVYELVMHGRYPHLAPWQRPGPRDRTAVENALTQTDMNRFADRRMDELSGGEFRRALLASVLAQEPELLFLDEPVSGLDIHHATGFIRLLTELAHRGVGVLFVTHNLNLASLFCDRLMLLSEGTIFASGPPNEVLTISHLGRAYGNATLTVSHPETGAPMVLPRRDQ